MNARDLLDVLGESTVMGLGTAQEQRARGDKYAILNAQLQQRKQQADATRLQNLQKMLETATYHQGMIKSREDALDATKNKPVGLWDSRTWTPVGEAPLSAPLPVLSPAVPAFGGVSDADRLNYPATPAEPEVRAIRGSVGDVARMIQARTQQSKLNAPPKPDTFHVVGPQGIETMTPGQPAVVTPHAPGFTPGPAEKPIESRVTKDDGSVELVRTDPSTGDELGRTQLQGPQPGKQQTIVDEARLRRLRADAMAQRTIGDDVMTLVDAGKPITDKQRRDAISSYRSVANFWAKTMPAVAKTDEDYLSFAEQAREAAANITKIQNYRPGPSASRRLPASPTGMPDRRVSAAPQVPADRTAKMAMIQAEVDRLYGKGTQWSSLSDQQRGNVINNLNQAAQ